MDERIAVTYRCTDDGWEPVLSTGERLDPCGDLVTARAAVRARLGADPAAGTENVKVPLEGHGVRWAGLRFELLPPLYGADAPTPEQNDQLTACFEYYRSRVPAGVRVECAGNRVRIDPAPFGLQADLFAALEGGFEPGLTADPSGPHSGPLDGPLGALNAPGGAINDPDGPLGGSGGPIDGPDGPFDGLGGLFGGSGGALGGPGSALGGRGGSGPERARAQLAAVLTIEVPQGFVRVAHDYVGLDEYGDVGHVHLILAERWPADAPCL